MHNIFRSGKIGARYEDFNWRYIQSEHFDVYYYQSKNYDLANFAAYTMESSLKQLQDDFDHQIADRIRFSSTIRTMIFPKLMWCRCR
ncbi:MAG: hypothetical protein U5J63_12150 [Fodinibius sp.]|nr:hypothetical protein [Fodinibius sp.]